MDFQFGRIQNYTLRIEILLQLCYCFGSNAMNINRTRFRTLLFALVFSLTGRGLVAQTGFTAITRPSADTTLSFLLPGCVAKVLVQEGDRVQAGQLLVQLDDKADLLQLAQLDAHAKNTAQIRAAEASLAQKQVDLKRLEWAAGRGSATDLEVEHARLDVKIAELSVEVAQFEHEQAIRKHEEYKLRLQNMQLSSPISGSVELINIEVGESVKALDMAIRVVRIDPLWIDVPVLIPRAVELRVGQKASVSFPSPKTQEVEGKIVFVAKAADAASDTLRVRIEIANPSGRPCGEHVSVVFRE